MSGLWIYVTSMAALSLLLQTQSLTCLVVTGVSLPPSGQGFIVQTWNVSACLDSECFVACCDTVVGCVGVSEMMHVTSMAALSLLLRTQSLTCLVVTGVREVLLRILHC